MKRRILFLIVVSVLTVAFFSCNSDKGETQVLVIGTIHGDHQNNPNYSYRDIINILDKYNPDAICVEIPASYFRKRSYLTEMMLASIYGFENGKEVYPIDWWTETDARGELAKYKTTEDYRIKTNIADSLTESNAIMQNFIRKYGDIDNVWRENKMGYEFFNGEEYNDYICQMYTIAINVYGDGCVNLYSEQRNAKMMEMIDEAIEKNKGKRIIVLTGAEHKYYFDAAFSKRNDVELVQLKELLPLENAVLSKNISEYIDTNMARGYYDVSDSLSIDIMYSGALISLIHGIGMDEDPNIVPVENIEKAQPIIAEWEGCNQQSMTLLFEKIWIKFLEKDYRGAIELAESIPTGKLDEITQEHPDQRFIKPFYWRNIGLCYDMVGERDKAINAYRQGEKVGEALGLSERYVNSIFEDLVKEPYNREKSIR